MLWSNLIGLRPHELQGQAIRVGSIREDDQSVEQWRQVNHDAKEQRRLS